MLSIKNTVWQLLLHLYKQRLGNFIDRIMVKCNGKVGRKTFHEIMFK